MISAVTLFSSQGDRPGQEDHALIQQEKGIFVIADGFGGPLPGAEAAKMACEAVKNFLFKEAGDRDATLPFELRSYYSLAGNVLFNSLVHANQKVLSSNKGKNVHERGGASVLAGFLDEGLLALANVGGCSAWMFRGGEAAELVIPRTYARLCDPFSKDAAPERRIPLTALGISKDLEPEIFEYRVRTGDWILVHTDGVDSSLREKLRMLHQEGLAPTVAAQRALEMLNQSEFRENSTLSLVAIGS